MARVCLTWKTAETERPHDSSASPTTEVRDYASNRARILEILEFPAGLRHIGSIPHWHQDAQAAEILADALRSRMDNV